MPLYPIAERLIRGCFSAIKRGQNPRRVAIGKLTDKQLKKINENRAIRGWNPIVAEVLFHGRHIFESRVTKDGYKEEDVITQILSGMSEESEFKLTSSMTVLRNPRQREDGYGSRVNDEAVLECTSQHPNAIVFSVIPKGDIPPNKRQPPIEGGCREKVADPPG